jgi:signal transduction histidine kinase
MDKALNDYKANTNSKKGFVIAFILLLASILIMLYTNNRLEKQSKTVERTNEVILNLEFLLSKLKDAETGIRGYVITADTSFLAPYVSAGKNIDSALLSIQAQTKDNPLQQKRLNSLKILIIDRLELLLKTKLYFTHNGKVINDSIQKLLPQSKRRMDEIRLKIKELQTEEKSLLLKRTQVFSKSFANLKIFSISSFIVSIILFGLGMFTLYKEAKAKKVAVLKIRDYQETLRTQVDELDAANKELMRMRAQEKFAATGRIARTIAHEIRNPLTNINLASEQLRLEYLNENEDAGFLFEMIERNSSRINQLISDLLKSTKFAELHFSPSSINDIIEETLIHTKDRIVLTGTTIEKKLYSSLPLILVDNQKIKIAFTNLIVNALEAMEGLKNSLINIETTLHEKHIVIKIRDNGPGMDAETLNKLFEPYFTSKPKGNGLGLTNTQSIILSHKGEITVTSKPEKGTSFFIYLNT